jgi:hypothetical protein
MSSIFCFAAPSLQGLTLNDRSLVENQIQLLLTEQYLESGDLLFPELKMVVGC